jgi:hypothetical protein
MPVNRSSWERERERERWSETEVVGQFQYCENIAYVHTCLHTVFGGVTMRSTIVAYILATSNVGKSS